MSPNTTEPAGSTAERTDDSDAADGAEPHRLTVLHGFGQNAACWGHYAEFLERRLQVRAVDAPGHGSADSKRGLDCAEAGSEIISAAGHGDFLGYSMGARILLAGAVARPELVRRLVLISGTAGIADQAERDQRRDLDQVRADALMRTGVEAFMEEWLAMEMFADLPVWARFERQRLANTAEGLADSLRTCGTGSMDPLWDRIGSLEMPVLCVAGGNDSKFCDLARQMADAIGDNAEVAIIAETGHATHLEAPSRCAELVLDFLS